MVSRGAELTVMLRMRDETSKALAGVNKSFKGINNQLKQLRGPLLGVTAALGGIGVISVKSASDLGESVNKANQVFGESVDIIREFAKTSADSFGISMKAANEYSATLGLLLKASGLSEEAAAGMSVEMVQLAADLASFNNIGVDEALEKIRSGLVGQAQPLRSVGVLLSEAAVKAKAYEMGLASQGQELTEQMKVQARYALILEQTSDAQGDFDRTNDSLANQLRRTQAAMTDISAQLGEVLLPAVSKAIGLVNRAVQAFSDLSPQVKTGVVVVGALAGGLAAVGLAIPPIVAGVQALIVVVKLATASFRTLAGSTGLGLLLVVGTAVIMNWDAIRAKGIELWNKLVPVFEKSINFLIGLFNNLTKAHRESLAALVSGASKVAAVFDKDLARSMDKVAAALREGIGEIDSGTLALDELAESAEDAGDNVEGMGKQSEAAQGQVEGLTGAVQKASDATGVLADLSRRYRDAVKAEEKAIFDAIQEHLNANKARAEGMDQLQALVAVLGPKYHGILEDVTAGNVELTDALTLANAVLESQGNLLGDVSEQAEKAKASLAQLREEHGGFAKDGGDVDPHQIGEVGRLNAEIQVRSDAIRHEQNRAARLSGQGHYAHAERAMANVQGLQDELTALQQQMQSLGTGLRAPRSQTPKGDVISGTENILAALRDGLVPGFQTSIGEFKRVPGPMNQGMLATVHGGEMIGRPTLSKGAVNVFVELDGHTLTEALGMDMVESIRVRTGMRT